MVRPPSAGLPAPGSTAGLLTHGLCGLALLLQLPLQAGDLRLEVTCFCGSRERQALQRLPGPGGRFMPSAARTMIGHLGGALGRCWQAWPLHPAFSWAAVPCLHLPGLPYPPGGATGRLRKGSSLPQLPQASRAPRGLAAARPKAVSLCLTASAEARGAPLPAGDTRVAGAPRSSLQ